MKKIPLIIAMSTLLATSIAPLFAESAPAPEALFLIYVEGTPQIIPPVIDIGVVKPSRPQGIAQPITNSSGSPIPVVSVAVTSGPFAILNFSNESTVIQADGTFVVSVTATGEGSGPITGRLEIDLGQDFGVQEILLTANVDLVDSEAPNLTAFRATFEGRTSLPDGLNIVGVAQPPQVLASAALAGFYGLDVHHAGPAAPSFVQHFLPDPRSLVRTQFLFDPNSLAIPEGTSEMIASLNDYGTAVGWLKLRRVGTQYQLRVLARLDDGSGLGSAWLAIPDEPALLTFDWWAGRVGEYEGGVRVRHGSGEDTLTTELRSAAINFSRARSVRLGAVASIVDETEGHLFFDNVEIRF